MSHLEGLLHVQTNKVRSFHLVCFVAQLAEECTSSRGHGFNSWTGLHVHIQLPVTRTRIFNRDNIKLITRISTEFYLTIGSSVTLQRVDNFVSGKHFATLYTILS